MSEPTKPASERVRAQTWADYVGQKRMKDRLQVHAQAAVAQSRMLDPVLLVGPPGSGKTTIAKLIAMLMRDPFHSFMASSLDVKTLAYFCKVWEGGVLLIDEIHTASSALQTALLTALEDKVLNVPGSPPVHVDHITFIGATTEPQGVIKPLWDRFTLKPDFEPYSDVEMGEIVTGMAERTGVAIPAPVVAGLTRATGGTPRLAGKLVVAARDLAVVGRDVTVESVLNLAGVDDDGLEDRHVSYLRTLLHLGGTTGLKNICTMLQLSAPAVEDLERLLMTRGFVRLQSQGRTLTEAGMAKLPEAVRPNVDARRARRAS